MALESSNPQRKVLDTKGLHLGAVQNISPLPNATLEPIWSWIATTRERGPEGQKLQTDLLKLLSLLFRQHQISYPTEKSKCWTEIGTDLEQSSTSLSQDLQIQFLLTSICGHSSPDSIYGAVEIAQLQQNARVQNADGENTLYLLFNAILAALKGRRLAVLGGGLIAAVPEDTQLGDVVCTIIGCSVPVCLRKGSSLDHWTVLGDCYVYGYMNGDAIEKRNSGNLLTVEIYSLV